MLNQIIENSQAVNNGLAKIQAECLQMDGHQLWKTVTIHEFPDGVEVFVDELKSTWADGFNFEEQQPKSARGEGDRERSAAVAARRAKTQVRRLCKVIRADCMLTLTYRENMQDEKRVQADFKAFRARLKTLGDFPYVAVLEKQERGALHIHIACQAFPMMLRNEHGTRVKSFDLLRSMWRRVVGRDNGNVDVSKRRWRASSHKIASYIAKYVGKDLDDTQFNKKSYWSSKGIQIPKPIKLWFSGTTSTWDIVAMLAQDFVLRGYTELAQFADKLNNFHWFAASKP